MPDAAPNFSAPLLHTWGLRALLGARASLFCLPRPVSRLELLPLSASRNPDRP